MTKKKRLYNYEFGEFINSSGKIQRIAFNKDTGRIVTSGGVFEDRYLGQRFSSVRATMEHAGWKWVQKGEW